MSAAPQLIGRTVAGRFRITGFIGEGAMAAVYRGEQDVEPHDVAVKIMHPQLLGDSTFVGRFRREAKAAALLNHPNTVQIIDYGVDGRLPYIVMELVNGQDLFEILVLERRLAEDRATRLMMGICEALAVAHEHGIVHRDLKPENVMILPDPANPSIERVKVLDFGIAKIVDSGGQVGGDDGTPASLSTSALTTVGVVVGTPAYMSPEQCRGDPVDGRSDVYACGILLYLLVTGRLPFQPTGTPWEVAMEHIRKAPPAPSMFFPQLHPGLEAVILTALSKWPAQRQQSAGELRDDLARLLPSLSKESLAPPAADTLPVESLRSRAVVSVRAAVEEHHELGLTGAAVEESPELGLTGADDEDHRPAPPPLRTDTETRTSPLMALPTVPAANAVAPTEPPVRKSTLDATTDPLPRNVARSLDPPASDPPPWDDAVVTRVLRSGDPSRSAPLPPTGPSETPSRRPTQISPVAAPAQVPASASAPVPPHRPTRTSVQLASTRDSTERRGRRQGAPVHPSESLMVKMVVPVAVILGVLLGVLAFFLMR